MAKNRTRSLAFSATALFGLLASLMLSALVVYIFFSWRTLYSNNVALMQSSKALYVNHIKESLNVVSDNITGLASSSMDDVYRYGNLSSTGKQIMNGTWQERMNETISFTDYSDFFFLKHGDSSSVQVAFSNRIIGSERIEVIDFLSSSSPFENDTLSGNWHLVQIGGVWYLLQSCRVYDAEIGGAVNLSTLLGQMQSALQPGMQYLLTSNEGVVLYSFGPMLFNGSVIEKADAVDLNFNGEGILVSESIGAFRFLLLKEKAGLILDFDFGFWIAISMGIISLAMVFFVSRFIRKRVLLPIQALNEGIQQLEKGNYEYHVEVPEKSGELTELTSSFNDMAMQIKHSKDLEVERQNNELKFLKMQIRPHFYLNAITTMSSLAYQNQGNRLQQFSSALSKYIRYLLDNDSQESTVGREIAESDSFIDLYRIREPEKIYFMKAADSSLDGIPVPRFLILTAVENSMKHSVRNDSVFTICISTAREGNSARISIEDNGPGFPADYLSNPVHDEGDSERIGLANMRRILLLKYGDRATMQLSNVDSGGARVCYLIPISEKEEGNAGSDC